MISIEDMDKLARERNSIVVSVHMKLNLEALLVSAEPERSPAVAARCLGFGSRRCSGSQVCA